MRDKTEEANHRAVASLRPAISRRAAKNKDSEIRQKKIQKMSHKIGGDTGVNEQVTKPIQPDILQRILQEIISRQMI